VRWLRRRCPVRDGCALSVLFISTRLRALGSGWLAEHSKTRQCFWGSRRNRPSHNRISKRAVTSFCGWMNVGMMTESETTTTAATATFEKAIKQHEGRVAHSYSIQCPNRTHRACAWHPPGEGCEFDAFFRALPRGVCRLERALSGLPAKRDRDAQCEPSNRKIDYSLEHSQQRSGLSATFPYHTWNIVRKRQCSSFRTGTLSRFDCSLNGPFDCR
jgi:hypothetical protein